MPFVRALAQRYEESVRPVVVLEMRMMMRSLRGPLALFICSLLPVGLALVLLHSKIDKPGYSVEAISHLGRTIFQWLLLLEAGIVVVLAPLLAAGMIAREYHQQTLEGTLLTRLTGAQLLGGKLLVTVGLLGVALFAAVPAIAVVFLLGGVSPWELGCALVLLLLFAAYQAAIALFCTIRFGRAGPLAMFPLTALGVAAPWLLFALPLTLTPRRQRRRWRLRYLGDVTGRWLVILLFSLLALPFVAVLLGPVSPGFVFAGLFDGASSAASTWGTTLAIIMLWIGARQALANAAKALHLRQYEQSERYEDDLLRDMESPAAKRLL